MKQRNENNTLTDWLGKNSLALIGMCAGMLFAWAVMTIEVNNIKAKIDEYPSKEWFDLKFNNIDESINELEIAVHNKADRVSQIKIENVHPTPEPSSMPFAPNILVNVQPTEEPKKTPENKPEKEEKKEEEQPLESLLKKLTALYE